MEYNSIWWGINFQIENALNFDKDIKKQSVRNLNDFLNLSGML